MADVTKVDQTQGLMDVRDTASAVFDGKHQSTVITKPVNQVQLLDEIDEALGDPERFHVVMHIDDAGAQVSKTNPLTIYVHPDDVDMDKVAKAIRSHKPEDDYGRSDEQRELDALRKKLGNEDLDLPEINKLLRSFFLG